MFADGSLGVRRIWWLLQCSHLTVPLCIVVCPVGARLTAVCGAAMCPVALLLAFLPISGCFFLEFFLARCIVKIPWFAITIPPLSKQRLCPSNTRHWFRQFLHR